MSAILVLIICFLFICSLSSNLCALQYLKMSQDQSLVDQVPPYTPAWIFHLSMSKVRCVAKCLEIHDCSVMVYNNVTLVCNLYEQTSMATATSSLMTEKGWTFYHKNQRLCPNISGFIYSYTIDRCIKMGLDKTTHTGAVVACQSDNSMLAKVDSRTMWQFVSTYTNNNNLVHTYIQGTKDAAGTWRYDDGSVIQYFKWGNGEPDNKPVDVNLILWSNDAYYIYDVSGTINYNYVCEIDLK